MSGLRKHYAVFAVVGSIQFFLFGRKSSVYFITASLLIIGVEILQVLTMSGSGDIDDYILNIVGSMVMYFIVKLYRKVKKL